MYKGYEELRARPALAYLYPDNFRCAYDGLPLGDHAAQQYAHGLKAATEYPEVGISANGTWYASGTHSLLTSCEGIGCHANTWALLAGLLAGTAQVVVFRDDGTRTVIKDRDGAIQTSLF